VDLVAEALAVVEVAALAATPLAVVALGAVGFEVPVEAVDLTAALAFTGLSTAAVSPVAASSTTATISGRVVAVIR
jgi:hypothetical protein